MTQVSSDINNRLIVTKSSGTAVNGTAANADFTSDEICLEDKPWSVVFTFTGLTVSGQNPEVTFEGSNDPDLGADSWGTIPNGGPWDLGDYDTFKDRVFEFLFIRLVYSANGATGGTINVFVNQKMNVQR